MLDLDSAQVIAILFMVTFRMVGYGLRLVFPW